VMPCRDD